MPMNIDKDRSTKLSVLMITSKKCCFFVVYTCTLVYISVQVDTFVRTYRTLFFPGDNLSIKVLSSLLEGSVLILPRD